MSLFHQETASITKVIKFGRPFSCINLSENVNSVSFALLIVLVQLFYVGNFSWIITLRIGYRNCTIFVTLHLTCQLTYVLVRT